MNLLPHLSCFALVIAAGSFIPRVPQFVGHHVKTATHYLHTVPRAWVQPPTPTLPTVACGYMPSSTAGFRCWERLAPLPPVSLDTSHTLGRADAGR
jgi:hypothetical protein